MPSRSIATICSNSNRPVFSVEIEKVKGDEHTLTTAEKQITEDRSACNYRCNLRIPAEVFGDLHLQSSMRCERRERTEPTKGAQHRQKNSHANAIAAASICRDGRVSRCRRSDLSASRDRRRIMGCLYVFWWSCPALHRRANHSSR